MSFVERQEPPRRALRAFGWCLVMLVSLDILLAFVAVPRPALPWASLAVSFIALLLPVYALYRGAEDAVSPTGGTALIVLGVASQVLLLLAARYLFGGHPWAEAICRALAQAGLLAWCLGAGLLVSRLFVDRNLLLPVTIFLATLDIFLVLAPTGLTKIVMAQAPALLPTVGYAIPKVESAPTHGLLAQLAVVGPADLLFLSMFFAAIHKFGLRARATLWAMVATLFAYLLVVVFLADVSLGRLSLHALPALVPIGAVILIANAGQFKLARQEKMATLAVGVLMTVFVAWAVTRPKAKVEVTNGGVTVSEPHDVGAVTPKR